MYAIQSNDYYSLVFPLAKFKYIKTILLTLKDESEQSSSLSKLDINSLSNKTGLSKSLLSNNISTLKSLRLINSVGRRYIFLTSEGKALADALLKDDMNKIREIGRKVIRNSQVLMKAYQILKENPTIAPYELGLRLASEFNKEWDNRSTYVAVGSSCIDILSGFGLIKYDGTRRSRRITAQENKLRPVASADKIIQLIFMINNVVEIPCDFIQTQKEKEQFKTLVDLKLVEQIDRNKFKLSELGRKLKEEIKKNGDVSKVFREILFNHKASKLAILKLKEIGRFNWKVIGDVIEEVNQEQYKDITKKGYSVKFLTWLKKANLVEKVSAGEYVLKDFKGGESVIEERKDLLKQMIDEFKNSEYDILIWNGKIFVKFKAKIGNETFSEVHDYSEKLRGFELSGTDIESIKFDSKRIFIRLKQNNISTNVE